MDTPRARPSRSVKRLLGYGLVACGFWALSVDAAAPAKPRPNVLIIMIDDHPFNFTNVYQDGPVPTPNLRRLAKRGTWFSRGYNEAPICCASRTALLTGIHAAKSGVYYNSDAYRRSSTFISKVRNLPGNFMKHGYLTVGYGKIGHNSFVNDDIGDFTPGYFKVLNNPKDVTHPEDELHKHIIAGSEHKIPGVAVSNWTWGVLPNDWDRDDPTKFQQDTEQANRTIKILETSHDQPFFMICGFYRPHGPWTVAQRYYDQFPLESIQLPKGYRADDLEDVPKPGRWIATNRGEHAEVVAAGMWKETIRSIYASTAYIDEQIGRVLDALEKSPYNDNTIVVFAGDNGFHTGEKNHWLKFALWEQTNRVVFGFAVPGMPVQESKTPVSLIDIFPTLDALCGLSAPETHALDGIDLTPVLSGKKKDRGEPVISTYGPGNHSLRNDRYRYIRYRNGAEELYDEQADQYEFRNLAKDPKYAAIKAEMGKWMPAVSVPTIFKPGSTIRNATWDDAAFEPDPNDHN